MLTVEAERQEVQAIIRAIKAGETSPAFFLRWKSHLEEIAGSGGRFDEDMSLAWRQVGLALTGDKQFSAGAGWFGQLAVRTDIEYRRLEARVLQAGALTTCGRAAEALGVVEDALADPYRDGVLFTDLLLWQGRALRDLGRFDQAEQVGLTNLRRGRALLSPMIAKASMLFLGRMYLRRGRWLSLAKMAARLAALTVSLGPRLMAQRVRRKLGGLKAAPAAAAVEMPPMKDIRRIAVARLDGLGDLVLSFPAIRLLRESFPQAQIDLYVARPWGQVARWLGAVDNVCEIDAGGQDGLAPRMEPYDLSIDLMYHARPHQDGLMKAIPAAIRLGHATPENLCRCNRLCPLPEYRIHARDMGLRLLEQLGLRPRAPEDALPRLDRAMFALKGPDLDELAAWMRGRLTVGIHPGAGWPLRKWYPEEFAAVANHLAGEFDCRILVIGSPADEPMVDAILKGAPRESRKIICRELDRLAAVLASLQMLVCNDSGPMHLAGALGVPMTVIWGPGDYEQFSPLGSRAFVVRHQPVCAPCCQEGQPARCGMGHAWREVACLKAIPTVEVCQVAELLPRGIK